MKLNWSTKILLRFLPWVMFRRHAKAVGAPPHALDEAHHLFGKTSSVDIIPLSGNERGFILVLDRKVSLWFYQEGQHFAYDGFEIGEYEGGDVTVFDDVRNKNEE